MATNDRSVGLGELASRAQAGGTQRRAHSDCKNPECDGGMTPGLVAAGGGSKGQPLFGAGGVGAKRLMRWGWVNCLACNPSDDSRKAGARYRPLVLTQVQIAQRAQMASTKAAYQQQEKPARQAGTLTLPGAPSADSGRLAELVKANEQLNVRLDEMLKQNAEMMKSNAEMSQTLSRMAMQVGALLEDNAKLRAAQPASVNVIQGTSGNMST